MAGGVFAGFRSLVNTLDAVFSTMKLNGPSSTSLQMRMTAANYLSIVDQTYPGLASSVLSIDAGTLIMRGGISSFQGGTLWSVPKGIVTTTNPGVSDDGTIGYVAGSRWVNTSTGQFWTCRDASTGTAVWTGMDVSDHPGYGVAAAQYALVNCATAQMTSAAGVLYLHPFVMKRTITPVKFGIRCGSTAGANFKYGIWAHDATGTTGKPLVANPIMWNDTGAALAIGTSTAIAPTAPVLLEAGAVYWFGTVLDAASAVLTSIGGASSQLSALTGAPMQNNLSQSTGWTMTSAYATAISGVQPTGLTIATGAAIPLGYMGTT